MPGIFRCLVTLYTDDSHTFQEKETWKDIFFVNLGIYGTCMHNKVYEEYQQNTSKWVNVTGSM